MPASHRIKLVLFRCMLWASCSFFLTVSAIAGPPATPNISDPVTPRGGPIATSLPGAPELVGGAGTLSSERETPATQSADVDATAPGPLVFGFVALRGFAFGQQTAPNGLEFDPLFSLDLELNIWLSRQERVYAFADTRFWGQKAAPGITNSSQGVFDFSKREFDLDLGVAWNYYDSFEARAFAYSFNNLNRGSSDVHPSGYNDGVGLENRLYIGDMYDILGQTGYDVARANFLSLGYYPTKDMVDGNGNIFKPGPFARAFLTLDLTQDSRWYLYLDNQFIGTRSLNAMLIDIDGGVAGRPFSRMPYFEFRLGSEDTYDLQLHDIETSLYLAIRFIF